MDRTVSRRDALRTGGGALAAAGLASVGLAGCVERRVTRERTVVESSGTWPLSPEDDDASLSRDGFEDYVDRMADRYGDSGVWGLDAERPDDLEVAYVQRFAITQETADDPGGSEVSLDPDDVDPEAPLLVADACVALYDVGDRRHRYWLWTAADTDDSRLVRDVDLDVLATGVGFGEGVLVDAAEHAGSDDEATATLGGAPSATFPLRGGSLQSTTVRGEEGEYSAGWTGTLEGTQSVNGVCEEERDSEYDFQWQTSVGYSYEEDV